MYIPVNKNILVEYNLESYQQQLKQKNQVFISIGQVVSVTYLDICDDEVQQKTFSGVCIKVKSRINNSMFTLRNSFKQEVIDQSFFFNSPFILNIRVIYNYKKKFSLYKLYHLNVKSS